MHRWLARLLPYLTSAALGVAAGAAALRSVRPALVLLAGR